MSRNRDDDKPERLESLADMLEPPTRIMAAGTPAPTQHLDPARTSTFYFSGWTGGDWWRAMMPQGWQTRAAARKLARGPYKGLDFENHHLVIAMPWGFFRVLDDKGNTIATAATERPPI